MRKEKNREFFENVVAFCLALWFFTILTLAFIKHII